MANNQNEELSRTQSLNITERKQAEELFRLVVEAAPSGMLLVDQAGVITLLNAQVEQLFGYQRQELLGQPVERLMPERLRSHHADHRAAFYRTPSVRAMGIGLSLTGRRKDGSELPLEIGLNPISLPEGRHVLVSIIDITERTQAEEARTLLAAIVETSDDAIISKDLNGTIVSWNQGAERLFGYTSEEIIGQPITRLVPAAQWDEETEILTRIRSGGQVRHFETTRLRKDGSLVLVSIAVSPIKNASGTIVGTAKIVRDMTAHKQSEQGLRQAYAELEQRVLDRTAELTQANAALHDQISQRERLERQLRQSQKLEAIGRLAGGIAHDFNNLLTGINGNAELLLKQLDPVSPLYARAETIRSTGERASKIANQLLAVGRQQLIQPATLSLTEVIHKMADLLPPIIGEQIQLCLQLDSTIGWLKADLGQLEQVVLNLASNARDAMPSGGTLTIETRNVEDQVCLVVRDTGLGMSPDVQTHLFEPFFTTKPLGRGTGLGLSIVYGIVTQSGGTIAVESAPGQGTAFVLTFPRVEADVRAAALETRQDAAQTILLVEDQTVVRKLVHAFLTMQGYRVLEAAHGAEALQQATAYQGPIHLLLTDLMMPGMNGRELAEKIAAQRPEIPVVFMSGYTKDELARRGIANHSVPFVAKPFTLETLMCAVKAAMEAARKQASA